MNQRSFIALVSLTLLAAIGAWQTTRKREPETEINKVNLFPGLAQHVNDVVKIEVKDKTQTATVTQKDGKWVIENRAGYPALLDTVKKTVLGTTELKVLEAKTSSKELYSKLGVEDPNTENASSKLMMFSDKAGKPIVSLIVGKNRTAGSGPSALYVRKPNEPQALLVEGDLSVSADTADWLDKEVLNIDGNRISDIVVEQPGEKPLHVYRKEPDAKDLTLDNIPAGHKPKSQFTINSLATALENLRMDDVAAKSNVTFPKESTTIVRFQTFDGLKATANVAKIDNKTHVGLAFQFDAETAKKNVKPTPTPAPTTAPSGTPAATPAPTPVPTPNPLAPDAVEKDVTALNEKVGNWVYVLPEYKANLFTKKLSELAGPPEPEKPKSTKDAAKVPANPPPEIPESLFKDGAEPPHEH